jgi:hypothetical protein
MFFARQRSIFSGFTYDFLNAAGDVVGEMRWPDYARAVNARRKPAVSRAFTTSVRIAYLNRDYEIAFEYLARGTHYDIRFSLKQDGAVLACADASRSGKLFARPSVTLNQPLKAKLIRTSGFFPRAYALTGSGNTLGTVTEKSGLRLKRELVVDLPVSVSLPVQLFVLFLVCNRAYR